MKCYKVNNVVFGLTSLFQDFYKDNIEKYEIEDCKVNHHIECLKVSEILVPTMEPFYEIRNRKMYRENDTEYMIVFQNQEPVMCLEKDDEYHHIKLFMKDTLNGLPEIEYVYTGIIFMELCLHYGIQSMHGSAIEYNNQATIFIGPSGVGKSTHTSYWLKLEEQVNIINDDKPLLSLDRDSIYVSGSPWSGKTKINQNKSVPLKAIVVLEQGTKNTISKLSDEEKTIEVMRNINRPRQDVLWNNTESILEKIIKDIPVYRAVVINDIEAAHFVKKEIGA